ncbi:MAG: class I tRNA ligase family protein, partial [Emcibacteraceae bacterium]|nr:class I tRNA ligase family protein [Emcibacteraceae bacterium]
LSMIFKNCEGVMPTPGDHTDADKEILGAADALLPIVREYMDVQAFNKSLEAIWKVVSDANGYFAGEEPWALKKTDPERMATVLYTTAEIIRQVAIMAQPIIPQSAAKLLDQLNVSKDERGFDQLGGDHRLASGIELDKPEGVFPRYVADN